MAGGSLLLLLDDIAALLDDVALMTKVAAKKTAGVLGDDLAVNAEKVAGVAAERELPVVWAVAKGSFRNKLILVPAAMLISAVAPWLVIPLLVMGGLYLCYEGSEKIWHALSHSKEELQEEHQALVNQLLDPKVDPLQLEKERIRGAIRTDFILSAEIIVITLGIVADADLLAQVTVLSGIALVMTIGVYGLVAGIVKLDDLGLYLVEREEGAPLRGLLQMLGRGLVAMAPWLMRTLAVVGTAAMFLVGGGILVHGVHSLEVMIEHLVGGAEGVVAVVASTGLSALLGLIAGFLVLAIVSGIGAAKNRLST